MENNGKEAYIKVLEDFIQKLRSEEVTDFEIESSNPPQMMFSPEHRDFIRVPSENHSIDIRYTLKKKEVKGLFKCPECKNNLDEQMFCVKCCCKWTKSENIAQSIQQLTEALKRTEYIYISQLKKHSREYNGLSLLEQRVVVETLINDGCATKNGLKLLSNIHKINKEELKKDDFIAWGNYETIEEAENCSETIKDAIKESFEDFESHNNGGDTDYYLIPNGAKYCQDIIESRNMNFSQGNILKAAFCFNIQRGDSDYKRDLNKIIWFANRELNRIK